MRRRSARYKSLLNGVISTKADVRYASCVVTDVSAVGAKLIIMGRRTIPNDCVLHIEALQIHLGCRIIHRSVDGIGVQFQRPDLPMLQDASENFLRAS